MSTPEPIKPLLTVKNLQVHFPQARGPFWNRSRSVIRAVDGVSFSVLPGQTLGLVGESGCGKSTTARAVLRLAPRTAGEMEFDGIRLNELTDGQMQPLRQRLQMIFQDPYASLNPRMTVGQIISEPLNIYRIGAARERKLAVLRLMDVVGLDPKFLNRYPHEFSGGQRQRIGIARALSVRSLPEYSPQDRPQLIFCDEPVSALDVSIQAQIVNLLKNLQQQFNLSYVFIAHDLAVVRHMADTVAVMYLGRIVEQAPAEQLYRAPKHPYTQALLSAVAFPDPARERVRKRTILTGEVPSPDRVYPGCPFADRCPLVQDRCRHEAPKLEGKLHQVSCWVAEKDG